MFLVILCRVLDAQGHILLILHKISLLLAPRWHHAAISPWHCHNAPWWHKVPRIPGKSSLSSSRVQETLLRFAHDSVPTQIATSRKARTKPTRAKLESFVGALAVLYLISCVRPRWNLRCQESARCNHDCYQPPNSVGWVMKLTTTCRSSMQVR